MSKVPSEQPFNKALKSQSKRVNGKFNRGSKTFDMRNTKIGLLVERLRYLRSFADLQGGL